MVDSLTQEVGGPNHGVAVAQEDLNLSLTSQEDCRLNGEKMDS